MKSAQKRDSCPPPKRRKDDVDHIIDCIMGMETNVQLDLWTRMIDRHPFDLRQLQTIATAIDEKIKLDIISGVPYEIASYIMSFLGPKDLCQAAQTCRSWRTVCEDNRLWREKCKEEGLLSDEQTLDVLLRKRIRKSHQVQEKFATKNSAGEPDWKSVYMKHMSVLRNWRTRGFPINSPFITSPPAMQNQQQNQQQQNPQPRSLRLRRQPNVSQSNSSQAAAARELARYPPPAVQQEVKQEAQHPNDPSTDCHLMQLRCHEDSVITCLQFNPLTNTIVSGSDDQTLRVWSSDTGRCITTLEGHTGGVWSSQLSPDDIVISGATDRTVKVWEAHTGKLLHTLYGHTSTVRCLALDADEVVSGSRDMTLRLWDIKSGKCLFVFLGHLAAVRCVEFKNGTIVSGAYDHRVMVWDAVSGVCKHTLECHQNRIYSLQFDGKTIASGSLDSTICIWDAETGKLTHQLEGHSSLTSKMQLKGNLLVSANADSFCKIWDVTTGKCLQTLGGDGKHTSAITSVYFNNRHVVTSSDDGTVKLWDIKTGKFVRDLVVLPTASNGGVVWRIRASCTKLICAVGSRSQTEDTHLLVLDFNE